MPPARPRPPPFLLLLLLACQVSATPPRAPTSGLALPSLTQTLRPPSLPQLQAPCAQVMDSVFEKWKLYGDQCLHNLSLLPPPTGEPPRVGPCLPPREHSWALLTGRLGTGGETESRRGRGLPKATGAGKRGGGLASAPGCWRPHGGLGTVSPPPWLRGHRRRLRQVGRPHRPGGGGPGQDGVSPGRSWRPRGCRGRSRRGGLGGPALSWQGRGPHRAGARGCPQGWCWAQEESQQNWGSIPRAGGTFKKGTGKRGAQVGWGKCRVSQGRRVVRGLGGGSRGRFLGDPQRGREGRAC